MSAGTALREHWPEYLIEASLLGTFMVFICVLVAYVESPRSPLYPLFPSAWTRTAFLAFAVGAFTALLIYSPWGKRSGAHINPAVTLAFLHLKRVGAWDAFFYASAHFIGATVGVYLATALAGRLFTDPPVLYAITVPGPTGDFVALFAEAAISCVLMLFILLCVDSPRLARFTGLAVGATITLFILLEAPFSGTSMNPARTVASAIPGRQWGHLWIYLLGPIVGMVGAAQVFTCLHRSRAMACAKLLHPLTVRCIHCGFDPKDPIRVVER